MRPYLDIECQWRHKKEINFFKIDIVQSFEGDYFAIYFYILGLGFCLSIHGGI